MVVFIFPSFFHFYCKEIIRAGKRKNFRKCRLMICNITKLVTLQTKYKKCLNRSSKGGRRLVTNLVLV